MNFQNAELTKKVSREVYNLASGADSVSDDYIEALVTEAIHENKLAGQNRAIAILPEGVSVGQVNEVLEALNESGYDEILSFMSDDLTDEELDQFPTSITEDLLATDSVAVAFAWGTDEDREQLINETLREIESSINDVRNEQNEQNDQ